MKMCRQCNRCCVLIRKELPGKGAFTSLVWPKQMWYIMALQRYEKLAKSTGMYLASRYGARPNRCIEKVMLKGGVDYVVDNLRNSLGAVAARTC